MQYNKKTWVNRETEYPNQYRMVSTNGNIANVSIVPDSGAITVEGEKFDADTMNDMETRINNGFNAVNAEISTQDTTLRGLVTAETTRATGEENLINSSITQLNADLADEVARATGAENALSTEITGLDARIDVTEDDIDSLENRMTNAESDITTFSSRVAGLETSISLETDRAESAESTLQGNIDTVSSAINGEVSRATTAETSLSNAIQAEVTRATNAENELRTLITRAYKASGSIYFADLPSLAESRIGNVYNIKDAFITTAEFLEGAGKSFPAGTNIAIEEVEEVNYTEVTLVGDENPSEENWYEYVNDEYVLSQDTSVDGTKTYYVRTDNALYYDIPSGFIDTSSFITNTDYASSVKAGIVKPDGTTITADADGTIHSVGGGQGSAEAAERMIAPIEPDATASTRPYAIGRRLILNEVLYKATSAIAIGDALTVGTNIALANDITDFDTTPTSGSTKFVTSGGVYDYVDTMITQAIAASY